MNNQPHPFNFGGGSGTPDRDCVECGLPDRDPIHDVLDDRYAQVRDARLRFLSRYARLRVLSVYAFESAAQKLGIDALEFAEACQNGELAGGLAPIVVKLLAENSALKAVLSANATSREPVGERPEERQLENNLGPCPECGCPVNWTLKTMQANCKCVCHD